MPDTEHAQEPEYWYYDHKSVDINAIDSSEGWDPLYDNKVNGFSNPDQMVSRVLESADDDQIHQLQIVDHGGPTGFQEMGENGDTPSEHEMQLDPAKGEAFDANMRRLNGHFADDGYINLAGCESGKGVLGTAYLQRIAVDTGVPVSGAHNDQSAQSLSRDKPYYEDADTRLPGPYTTCYPPEIPGGEVPCAVTDPVIGMSYAPGEDPINQVCTQ